RHNAGVPGITMHNIRRPLHRAHSFQSRPAKENKTLSIISIAINIFAIKIARSINHIDGNILTDVSLTNANRNSEAAHIDRNRVRHRGEMKAFAIHLAITWHHQTNIMTKSLESFWQSSDNLSQASNFGKRL